jgi:hypothetical protein
LFLKKISGVRRFKGAAYALLFFEKLHEVLAQDVVVFDDADGYHGCWLLAIGCWLLAAGVKAKSQKPIAKSQ